MVRLPVRLASAVVLSLLAACAGASDDGAAACTGLTPGSDAYAHCVERLRLQQQMDLDRIRQARELDRGSSRL
jgi:hypothetical protein